MPRIDGSESRLDDDWRSIPDSEIKAILRRSRINRLAVDIAMLLKKAIIPVDPKLDDDDLSLAAKIALANYKEEDIQQSIWTKGA